MYRGFTLHHWGSMIINIIIIRMMIVICIGVMMIIYKWVCFCRLIIGGGLYIMICGGIEHVITLIIRIIKVGIKVSGGKGSRVSGEIEVIGREGERDIIEAEVAGWI